MKIVDLIVPRRLEDRSERYKRIIYKKIQDYIKNGSKGNLWLQGTPIESLPSNLKIVNGLLNLGETKIKNLPDDLILNGSLRLHRTNIEMLPTNLTTIKGGLDLCETKIKSLPEGFKINGNLWLSNSSIESLPEGLTVGGSLMLTNTPISSLPSGLKVGGFLFLINARLSRKYTIEQIRQMIEDTGGYVKGRILK